MLAIAGLLAGCGGSGSSGSGGSSGTISVSVAAAASTIDGADTTTLNATVTNDKNAAGVSWSVSGGGTLSNQTTTTTTYAAPAATSLAQSITVTATSIADSTKTSSATITVPAQLAITTANSGLVGAVGASYSVSLTATGGISPYTWSVASGSTLPAGLSLSTTGALSGTPTAAAAGSTSVQFTVKDSGTPTALTQTQALTISITASSAITFTGTMPSAATLNTAYSGSAAATGGTGALLYSLSSGSLPNGLALNSSSGAISGAATAAGTFNFTVKAADSFGDSATKAYRIVVSYPALSITSASSLPAGYVGASYLTSLAASGGSGSSSNYTWALASGSSLPTGLTLSSAGTISGKPTGSAGTTTFTATVTDSVANLSASATFSITISNGLGITNSVLIGGNVGAAYSITLTATGGTGSGYTWSASASNLSTYGLSLSSTGQITGTPTQAGTASFTAQVTDSSSATATQALSITIYTALSLPASPSSLPSTATVSSPYTGTITGSGGSGSYSWTVTGLSDNLTSSAIGSTLTVTGTPSSAAAVSFNVTLKDSTTTNTTSLGYTITASTAAPLTLPALALGTNYTGQPYANSSIYAIGGVAPYSWTVNSVAVPTNGSQVALSDGIYVTNDGTFKLTIAGTPTAVAVVAFTATVKDNTGATATQSYSIGVVSSGYTVSGNVYLANVCGASLMAPTITLSINTTPVKTATTDSNGNFTFSNIQNGTYSITPSSVAPSAAFSPSALSVTVNNGAISAGSLAASLGYNVSGSASYSGAQSGPVYIWAYNSCTQAQVGTVIPTATMSSGGAFTIHGVPLGTYTLYAKMDAQNNGFPINESFPVGASSSVAVTGGNVTGQTVVLSDPVSYAVTGAPTLKAAAPTEQGVIIDYGAITGTDSNGNTVEVPPYYQIQWSSTNSFASPTTTTSFVFPASAGDGASVVILNNATSGVSGSPFTDGATLYFRMRGYVSSSSSNNGPWAYFGGSSAATASAVTIGTPSGANTVSGSVTFTGTAIGPLYVGFFSPTTGKFYGQRIQSPVSPQSYSVQVPNGTGYYFIGIVDNNNDGLADAGDFTNTRATSGPTITNITGSATGINLTLPSNNTTVTVTTQNNQTTSTNGTGTNYGVYFDLRYANKVPVSAELISGPNLMTPVDIGRCATCGAVQFQYGANLSGSAPSTGNTYTFQMTYTDGSTEQVTGAVTGVNTAYPTGLAPQGSVAGQTTPTFSWNYPSNPANYIYQFNLSNANRTTIWEIPTSLSSTNGFTNTQVPSTSGGAGITWNTDPLGGSNIPSVTSLTSGTTYDWSITSLDSNGNAATRTVYIVP